MDVLKIKLMYEEAVGRLNDAEILSKNIHRETDSNYLLELLAFEILLKCYAYINIGHHNFRHYYDELYKALPDDKKSTLINLAKERMSTSANYSNIESLFKNLGNHFIVLRYPYEKYEGMSEQEYLALGIKWAEDGAKIEDANFIYYPNELFGLNCALKVLVQKYVANK